MFPVILFALVVGAAPAPGKVTLPDVREGNVDGIAGLLFWPAAMPPTPEEDAQPLPDAGGCKVYMVPHESPDRELRFACGKWFAPPAGRYNVWLETDGAMTPSPKMSNYSAPSFQGRGMGLITPVAPAGRVAIPAGKTLPAGEGLRILSVAAKHAGARARIFDRRISARAAGTPVQMPVGQAVVGRFDQSTNEAIALARPVEVRPGRTVFVWPASPSASDVLVVLSKSPALQLSKKPGSMVMTLSGGGKNRAPDVFVDGAERLIAIWYGVNSQEATISLRSDVARWEGRELRLTPGKVATVRSSLEP